MSNTEALRAAAQQALAAMEKYPVTVNHWKAVLLPAADALRAALAQQPAADHVPAGPDAEAATDAALGLVLLPPIRVSEKAHTMLQRIASGHGMPLQAVVRYALEPGEVMGAAQQPAASGEPASLDTPGNRHPEHRYAGYKGEPLKAGATDDQRKAWEEGRAARADAAGSPIAPQICSERSAQVSGPVYCGDSGSYCSACPKREAAPLPVCKGMNCGATDGRSHSLECHAEHAAAIAGGQFVKAASGEPVARLERGEGGAFKVRPDMDNLLAIYALPPGDHALYAAPQPAPARVPPGWQLVPVEPTQAMCQEGQWKAQEWPKFPLRIAPIWKAMLAAAPTAQQEPARAEGE